MWIFLEVSSVYCVFFCHTNIVHFGLLDLQKEGNTNSTLLRFEMFFRQGRRAQFSNIIFFSAGFPLFYKFYAEFVVSARQWQLNVSPRKKFVNDMISCLKILDECLKIFALHEGEGPSNDKMTIRFTEEATFTLSRLKKYMNNFLTVDSDPYYSPYHQYPGNEEEDEDISPTGSSSEFYGGLMTKYNSYGSTDRQVKE